MSMLKSASISLSLSDAIMAMDTKLSAWNLSHAYENGTGASRMDSLYKCYSYW